MAENNGNNTFLNCNFRRTYFWALGIGSCILVLTTQIIFLTEALFDVRLVQVQKDILPWWLAALLFYVLLINFAKELGLLGDMNHRGEILAAIVVANPWAMFLTNLVGCWAFRWPHSVSFPDGVMTSSIEAGTLLVASYFWQGRLRRKKNNCSENSDTKT